MTASNTNVNQAEQAQRDEAIAIALAQLETSLQDPAEPSKRPAWFGAIRDAFSSLDEPLRQTLTAMHDDLFTTIIEQDDGLIRRVEQLKETDAKVLATLDELQQRTEDLIQESAVGDDEQSFRSGATKLTTDAKTFLSQIQLHRKEVTTCLHEAFNRDRGRVG